MWGVLYPAVAALDGGGQRPTARETMRIVIADDHETYRRGLARAIRRFGTLDLVGEATDGTEALQVIREASPDIAVLDVRMPGLDGLEVARRAAPPRSSPGRPRPPGSARCSARTWPATRSAAACSPCVEQL
jgi:CheY-like chemotaxis protein